jgi:hypothetical protein
MGYRRRPKDAIWHHQSECGSWPGGTYEGCYELPASALTCFECDDLRRAEVREPLAVSLRTDRSLFRA